MQSLFKSVINMEQVTLENRIKDFNFQNWVESDVIDLIINCLDNDETYDYKKGVRGSSQVTADLFLPGGCRMLGFPKKSIIEIKRFITSNALQSIRLIYDNSSDFNEMIVISGNYPQMIDLFLQSYLVGRNNIRYITINELLNLYDCNKTKIHFDNNKSLTEDDKRRATIEYAKKEIKKDRQIVFFLGAGVSMGAGVIGWDDLLKGLTKELYDKEDDTFIKDGEMTSIQKGRYIIDEFAALGKDYVQSVKQLLYSKNPRGCALIDSIAKYAFILDSIITYNYDDLVETKINSMYDNYCCPIFGDSRMREGCVLPVYHVHGFIPQSEKALSSKIVLGEKQYHQIYQQSYNWSNVEQIHALSRKTCFFIGLSMKDPNLRRLIDFAKTEDGEAHHIVFLKRESEKFDKMNSRIFEEMGIRCLWLDSYDDLPSLLDSLLPPPEHEKGDLKRAWDHKAKPIN